MVLDKMIAVKSQLQDIAELERMIASADLVGTLQAFLLCCKVDGLSPATIRDYNQKIGAFVNFCIALNIKETV